MLIDCYSSKSNRKTKIYAALITEFIYILILNNDMCSFKFWGHLLFLSNNLKKKKKKKTITNFKNFISFASKVHISGIRNEE